MALPVEPVEIMLKGLSQKHDPKLLPEGALSQAENVVFDKAGALSKRKGYERIPLASNVALGADEELVLQNVATFHDELVAFGIDDVYALADRQARVDGDAWVNRGPAIRGSVHVQHVATGAPFDDPSEHTENYVYTLLRTADQVDVASLTFGGVFYRCYTWLDMMAMTIGAACFAVGENGQEVLVWSNEVVNGAAESATRLDCPKLVAYQSRYFVLHWLDNSFGELLRVRWFDMDSQSSGWQGASSTAIDSQGLYDVAEDEAGGYVLAYSVSATEIELRRYTTGLGLGLHAWSTTPIRNQAPRCLGVYAHAGDDFVAFVYQATGAFAQRLYLTAADLATGTIGAPTTVEVFDAIIPALGLPEYCAVSMCRIAQDEYAVVADFRVSAQQTLAQGSRSHSIAYTTIRMVGGTTPTQIGSQHWCHNLNLASRCWAYADGTDELGVDSNVYCAVSYNSSGAGFYRGGGLYEQGYGFVVNLMRRRWADGGDGTLRPLPIVSLNQGNFDASPLTNIPSSPGVELTGRGRRMNHLSHVSGCPDSGPAMKTRTFAASTWSRITASPDPVTETPEVVSFVKPDGQQATGYRVHLEDPWLYHRDRLDPNQPAANFVGAYPWTAYQTQEIGAGLFGGGGTPWVYDGYQVVECGFCWYPEILQYAESAGTGTIAAGQYTYTAVYEWRDRQGQLHQSSPATPVTYTKVDDSESSTVEIWVRSINLSAKNAFVAYPEAEEISIVLYRQRGAGVFHRVEPSRVSANDPTAWRTAIPDITTDLELDQSALLPYTLNTDGSWTPIEPIQPPASTVMARWKNRIWLANAEGPRALWYSQEVLPQPGGIQYTVPEFHPVNQFRLDDVGQVTALQEMDNVLAIFSRDKIYVLQGDGNDGNGGGSSLTLQVIGHGVGCIEPRSVVLGPDGVYFQSAKGYYLLSRGFDVDYVGAGASVEDDVRLAGNVRSATLLEDRHEIRLVTNDSVAGACRVLVYDYLAKMWSKAMIPNGNVTAWLSAGQGGCAWRGHLGETAHVVLQQGQLYIERASGASEFADDNAVGTDIAIPMRVRTGWIHLAGLSGYKRVRELAIQLSKPQSSSMSVLVEYDRDGSYTSGSNLQTVQYTAPAPSTLRVRCAIQKVNAIRVTIVESGTVPLTENVSITSITMLVGKKTKHVRVPDTHSGTTA